MSIVNKRYRVPLADNLRKSVTVDPKATEGAILGVNLFDASGNLYKISDIVNPAASDSAASGSDLSDNTTDDLQEGAFNEYFTVERAQDAVAAMLVDTETIGWHYDDAGNALTADFIGNTDDVAEGASNLYYTDARVDARIAAQAIYTRIDANGDIRIDANGDMRVCS